MRVNQNNPINLFAANIASKSTGAKPANLTAARPDLGITKPMDQVPTSKPVKLDLTSVVADSASTSATQETKAVDAEKKFVIPEGATLQGLMNEWGQGESKYDFTQDGQVNVEDMLVMFRNWQESFGDDPTGARPTPSNNPTEVDAIDPITIAITPNMETAPTPVPPTTVNGAVDTTPLVPDSIGLTTANSPEVTPDIPEPTDPTTPQENVSSSRPSLSGLLGAWGKNNTEYDFNVDGTVNVDDLLLMIQNWPGPAGASPQFVQDTFENNEPARRSVKSASANGKLQQLAEQISTRLTAEGFGDQPPMNIRELVAQLNLSPKQTDFMMQQMQAKYPQGLGVSVLA